MSILIKGLGMPNAHQVRPFYLKGNGDGTATVYEYTTGMQTGVAVALPEKHGRLVDADALNDKLIKLADNWYTPKVFASWLTYEENAPTIVPAEGGTDDGN